MPKRSPSHVKKGLRDRSKLSVPAKLVQLPSPKASRKQKTIQSDTAMSDIFATFLNKIRGLLNKIRFQETMIDAYNNPGWGASKEKLRPVAELNKAKVTILNAKQHLRLTLQELMEGEEAKSERRLQFNEDGISGDDIYCAVCDDDADENEHNDILLCDLEGCNRGFHQKCCTPEVSMEEMEGTEDWFCRRCSCAMKCLNDINDHFETDFDFWFQVFPQAELDKEIGEVKETNLSRRGRKIIKPTLAARAAWDTHSFHSNTEDESFDSEPSENSSEDDEDDESIGEVLMYKRARKEVDYQKLASEMFIGKEELEDNDFIAGKDSSLDEDMSSRDLLELS